MTLIRNANGVVELRQYTLHPGRRDDLIAIFEREFVETQEAVGMELVGTFRDAANADRFVWIRAFPNMDARKRSLAEFYGGPVWQAHRDAANETMIDSDNVLLLRPRSIASGESIRAPLLAVIYPKSIEGGAREIQRRGGTILASFETETSPNTFPRLPVREDADVVVLLTEGIAAKDVPHRDEAEIVDLLPTSRSRMQFS